MVSTGALIWISVKPLLKMAITTAFGIVLTKKDLFGNVAARGAGQIIVNITLPALLFSKLVPSFTSANIGALGPLILIGTLYQALGLMLAFIVRQFFWVPHRFRNGILAAGAWGNWGDIPTAAIVSITSAAPFNGTQDSDLAVAYVAVFILVFYVTLFPLGGHLLIAKDFDGPDFTDDEVRESFPTKVRKTGASLAAVPKRLGALLRSRSDPSLDTLGRDPENPPVTTLPRPISVSEKTEYVSPDPTVIGEPTSQSTKQVIFRSDGPGDDSTVLPYAASTVIPGEDIPENEATPAAPTSSRPPSTLRRAWEFIKTLNTPPTLAIFISFPIALVPRLKSLFVTMPISPHGPDGLAPLAFILDTANFIGGASVPLGLLCLGSALARLSVPKPWTRLPLGAIGMFTIAKLFIMPVLGVIMCGIFTTAIPIIDKNDKVLRFVCIFFSSVPTATSQVFITQLASPDGNAEHLSAFLVPQYALMFLSMTTLNAYALNLLYPSS